MLNRESFSSLSKMKIKVNIHTPEGRHEIKTSGNAWLGYYRITEVKMDDNLIDDIVMMIETFGSEIDKTSKESWKPGVPTSIIDRDILDRVIGQTILIRGIVHSDKSALVELRNICFNIVKSEPVSRIKNVNSDWLVNEMVQKVEETLKSIFYESIEPPLIIIDLATACTYEIIDNHLKASGMEVPPEISGYLKGKSDEQKALERLYQRLSVIENRALYLIHMNDYCTCIKRSFVALSNNHLIRLALIYYQNKRLPDKDILVALADIGEEKTTHGTPVTEDTVDKRDHDICIALRKILVQEFSRVLTSLVAKHNVRSMPSIIKAYLSDVDGQVPGIDTDKLNKMFSANVGTSGRELMGGIIIDLCRNLDVQFFNRRS